MPPSLWPPRTGARVGGWWLPAPRKGRGGGGGGGEKGLRQHEEYDQVSRKKSKMRARLLTSQHREDTWLPWSGRTSQDSCASSNSTFRSCSTCVRVAVEAGPGQVSQVLPGDVQVAGLQA